MKSTAATLAGDPYVCDCPGFTQNMIERMCVRCLSAYVEGLPHVLRDSALRREMRRVASVLARRIKDDPLLGSLPLTAVLRVADGESV